MKKADIKKLKKELKADGEKQTDKLKSIASGQTASAEAAEKISAYAIEMRQSIAPARYPAAMAYRPGEEPQPLWMPHKQLLESMGIEENDVIYGVAFNVKMCLYKPKYNPYNDDNGTKVAVKKAQYDDPCDASWPSFLNAKKIAELCKAEVLAAEAVAMLVAGTNPAAVDPDTGAMRPATVPSNIKAVYQVGKILYIDYENNADMEGNPERERMLYCEADGKTEDLYKIGDMLYRPIVFDCSIPGCVLADDELGVQSPEPIMKYEELKKINEPCRIAQWYMHFDRFDVHKESEWVELLKEASKEQTK